jgi:hypothetical protein
MQSTFLEEAYMQRNNIFIMLIAAGILLVLVTGFWLATTTPANAQCGSQASSCKNCHEVQGQMSVNNDGTSWHQSHAFGDFCYICHAGNNQATDKDKAHNGMVSPFSDVKASCMQCHPDDLEERAQVYASVLGVEIGTGGTVSTETGGTVSTETGGTVSTETGGMVSTEISVAQQTEQSAVAVPALTTTEINLEDPNLVDFVQRYEKLVLGKRKVNWGNMILIGLIGLVIIGGGGFVIKNEGWLDFSTLDTDQLEGKYPADVVEMVPAIAKLKPQSRKALRKILDNPDNSEKVLKLINELIVSGE